MSEPVQDRASGGAAAAPGVKPHAGRVIVLAAPRTEAPRPLSVALERCGAACRVVRSAAAVMAELGAAGARMVVVACDAEEGAGRRLAAAVARFHPATSCVLYDGGSSAGGPRLIALAGPNGQAETPPVASPGKTTSESPARPDDVSPPPAASPTSSATGDDGAFEAETAGRPLLSQGELDLLLGSPDD